MTSPQQRRDPQPIGRGGEVALVALAAVLMLLGMSALVGLGVAATLAGGGWVWPHGTDTVGSVLAGLLTGHPGRGLPPEQAGRVPGLVAVYLGVAVAELAMVVVATAGGVLFWRYHRPGDARRGMATRSETARVLGRSRLHAARSIIRPDLHGPPGGRHPDRPGRRSPPTPGRPGPIGLTEL